MELRVRFQGHSASGSFRFVIFNFVGLQLTRDLQHFMLHLIKVIIFYVLEKDMFSE